jgi:hypothetical protein
MLAKHAEEPFDRLSLLPRSALHVNTGRRVPPSVLKFADRMHVGALHGSLKFAIKEDLLLQEPTADSVPGTFRQTAEYFDANARRHHANHGRQRSSGCEKGCDQYGRGGVVA